MLHSEGWRTLAYGDLCSFVFHKVYASLSGNLNNTGDTIAQLELF